jgi:predicted secreted protein
MATAIIQGRSFFLYLSDDNWTTKYKVVCLEGQNLDAERSVQETDTQCGVLVSFGNAKATIQATGVCNTTPAAVAAGAGEASYKKLQTWFWANTALLFKRQSPDAAGTDLNQEGTCYISKLGDSAQVDGKLIFSMTLSVQGDVDITP